MSAITMPDDLKGFCDHCVGVARETFARDGRLVFIAIVGGSPTLPPIVMPFPFRDDRSKDHASLAIEAAAKVSEATFIVTIGEAWYLDQPYARDYDKIKKHYGTLEKAPMAKEGVHFIVESEAGVWVAIAECVPFVKGEPRTFGPAEFHYMDHMAGRFMGLLSRKGRTLQ